MGACWTGWYVVVNVFSMNGEGPQAWSPVGLLAQGISPALVLGYRVIRFRGVGVVRGIVCVSTLLGLLLVFLRCGMGGIAIGGC